MRGGGIVSVLGYGGTKILRDRTKFYDPWVEVWERRIVAVVVFGVSVLLPCAAVRVRLCGADAAGFRASTSNGWTGAALERMIAVRSRDTVDQ